MKVQGIYLLFLLLSTASSQDSRLIFTIPAGHYTTGSGVSFVGDINGDGHAEFLVAERGMGRYTVFSGRDASTLYVTPSHGGGFGQVLVPYRDVNGDAVTDLAISAPGMPPSGAVYLVDPTEGTIIRSLLPPPGGRSFGHHLTTVDDTDGDGERDLLVTDPLWQVQGAITSSLLIYGSRNLTPTVFLTGGRRNFAYKAEQFGDVDGDGLWDLLVNDPANDILRIHSRRTGLYLTGIAEPWFNAINFGRFFALPGDLDGDGVGDIVTSYGTSSPLSHRPLGLRAYSGRTQAALWVTAEALGPSGESYRVLEIPDQNGDNVPDILIGRSAITTSGWQISMRSGASGDEIFSLELQFRAVAFGDRMSFGGDINADGNPDFIAGAFDTAAVFSSVPLSLTTDRQDISYGALHSQVMRLRAGSSHAGKHYQVLGSYSGISPGFPLPPAGVLPLNLDEYFVMSYQYPGYPPFINFRYTLDANGEATAYWRPLPGFPEIVGFRLDHAFAVLGPTGIDLISNSVPLTVFP